MDELKHFNKHYTAEDMMGIGEDELAEFEKTLNKNRKKIS